jgi:hypothetical protein
MKGSIKNSHLRHGGSVLHRYPDAHQVGWIVQWCQRDQFLDSRYNSLIDTNRN